MKLQLSVLFSLLGLLGCMEAKLCFEECSDVGALQNVEIHGCYRRSTYPHKQNFRCRGRVGPPCTVVRGQTVYLDLKWTAGGFTNITQDVVWQSGFLDLPWAGMETDICKYTNNGSACSQPGIQGETNHLMFPIYISEYYPAGKYNLKWKIMEHPSLAELTCFLFTIKIV
uniref:MD-2-related lipid-recognition protein-like protein n=1 Tax=Pseudodiaptomus poplesia TaxID=213370 RepID=A0A1S6GLG7_9MAXI|nr:MD-2-related lipid-recognition protein-like protein [Pseudodiaptomus poplesia]